MTTNSLDVDPERSSKALLTSRDVTQGLTETKERPISDLGMLSSAHNETVVSRSQMKSSLMQQRVYEISDNEKAKRWARILAQYYRTGM